MAAFPFVHTMSPATLTYETLIKLIAIYTGRLQGLLTSDYDLAKLYFLSFATVESQNNKKVSNLKETETNEKATPEHNDEKKDKDDLVEFFIKDSDTWDALPYVQDYDHIDLAHSYISAFDLYNLVTFLLCIFELRPEQSLSTSPKFSQYFEDTQYRHFQKSALCILRAIDTEFPERSSFNSQASWEEKMKDIKIVYSQFQKAYQTSFSHLLEPLGALFGGLLYSNNFGDKPAGSSTIAEKPSPNEVSGKETSLEKDNLQKEGMTKLINPATMAQLGAMLGPELYHKLKKLYVGTQAGFSLRSFETKVFKWRAPTLLLVFGREISSPGASARERQFNDNIPPLSNLHNKNKADKASNTRKAYLFGAYVTEPWQAHTKNTFGTDKSLIIQLEPVQDKFLAEPKVPEGPYAVINPNHEKFAYFTRAVPGGLGFGSGPPQTSHRSPSMSGSSNSMISKLKANASGISSGGGKSYMAPSRFNLGNVSLTLDDSLEFAVFRHVGLGGSFRPTTGAREYEEWEDRFEISEVEVWGSGKDEDLEEQRKTWEWEEREALLRQRVNIKNMGEERAFMEMAGLVGNHGSGGSMG